MGVLGIGEKGGCAVFEEDGLYEGVHKGGATCAGCACVVSEGCSVWEGEAVTDRLP